MSQDQSDRKNITQPVDWWDAFRKEAYNKGMSLSEWMGYCCVQCLPSRARKRLSERIHRGRPSNEDTD